MIDKYSYLRLEAPPSSIVALVECIKAHPTYCCSSRWPDKLKSKLWGSEWFKLVEVLLATQADVRAGITGTEPERPHIIRNIEEYEEHLQPCVYDLARAVFNFIERNTGAEEAPKKLLASILFLMDSCRKWGEREVFESVYSKAVILRKLKME